MRATLIFSTICCFCLGFVVGAYFTTWKLQAKMSIQPVQEKLYVRT